MKVGIDLDDTLADLNSAWLERINNDLGTTYQREHWKDWNATFLHAHGIEDSTKYLSGDIYENVKPIQEAIDAVRKIMEIPGLNIRCVTANVIGHDEAFSQAKKKWLSRHFPELLENLQFSRVKKGLGLDILIDDGPHHFESPDFTGILVPQPWNRHVKTKHEIDDWKKAPQILQNVLKELGHPRKQPNSKKGDHHPHHKKHSQEVGGMSL